MKGAHWAHGNSLIDYLRAKNYKPNMTKVTKGLKLRFVVEHQRTAGGIMSKYKYCNSSSHGACAVP